LVFSGVDKLSRTEEVLGRVLPKVFGQNRVSISADTPNELAGVILNGINTVGQMASEQISTEQSPVEATVEGFFGNKTAALICDDISLPVDEEIDHLLWSVFFQSGRHLFSPKVWFVDEKRLTIVSSIVKKILRSERDSAVNRIKSIELKEQSEWIMDLEKNFGAQRFGSPHRSEFEILTLSKAESVSLEDLNRISNVPSSSVLILGYSSLPRAVELLNTLGFTKLSVFGGKSKLSSSWLRGVNANLAYAEAIFPFLDFFSGNRSFGASSIDTYMCPQSFTSVAPWLGSKQGWIRPRFRNLTWVETTGRIREAWPLIRSRIAKKLS